MLACSKETQEMTFKAARSAAAGLDDHRGCDARAKGKHSDISLSLSLWMRCWLAEMKPSPDGPEYCLCLQYPEDKKESVIPAMVTTARMVDRWHLNHPKQSHCWQIHEQLRPHSPSTPGLGGAVRLPGVQQVHQPDSPLPPRAQLLQHLVPFGGVHGRGQAWHEHW